METVNRGARISRSYGQLCPLAFALDLVGERWTLLIVRELLPGPRRYTQLKNSLTGIATNLLAERLRTLETNGIVRRTVDGGKVIYALTPAGMGLREAMEALGRWSAPLLMPGPAADDSFEPRWLTLAIPALLRGRVATPPAECGFEVGDALMVLRVDQDGPTMITDPEERPSTVFVADEDTVVGLAAGGLTIGQALELGQLEGDIEVFRSVFGERHA
ncbi:helix-turn-helix domain-containing protein [Tsukamurella sp. 8F]|uniref:winged helix-turn-helix transcriptional regulator n=1 Tax=unclassified Tsukamurella TaxID=2633480 RepID=UPI0023B95B33|nr:MULTISPECIES: helix-turn-helix domain-containing protein [unclassified Tsukamurella]MDF0531678.1 helix-turn-helix domain-containing protein [Tsukamurella sp. 8J]MDF0588924.1 helix-turn-helix domain-containing protein [Tsukamurella sp. 8F]